MNTEIWKSIPSWTAYEASSLGRIRRKDTGNIVNQRLNHRGYFRVNISMGMKKYGRGLMVHRLVLETFSPNTFHLPHGAHQIG